MDEKTVVGWLIAAASGVTGGLVSYGKMHQRVKELESKSEKTESKIDGIRSDVSDMKSDVSYIRGQLSKGVVVHTIPDGES